MKNPEQVRRIKQMASIAAKLDIAYGALASAYGDLELVVPMDHPIRRACHEAYFELQKALEHAKKLGIMFDRD